MDPIVFRDVHRAFGERRVLRGLSFSVAPGEVFALLGRNGAGKTTAVRVLLGLLEPMAGTSALLGVDSRRLDGEARERIAFVSEGHRLDERRTIERTLRYEAATRRRFDRERVEQRLRAMGLGPRRWVMELSRGERAQLALVLALAGRPEVLVFDDPGMGLDAVMRRELLDQLVDLLAEEGIAVLLTTHAIADAERLADRVGVLADGALVVDAEREDLRRRVSLRFLASDRAAPPPLEGLLGWRRVSEGFELTLLDADEERLRAAGVAGAPRVPDLEELFVTLTAASASAATAHPEGSS